MLLAAACDPLQGSGSGSPPSPSQFIHVDEGNRAEVPGRLLRLQQAVIRVPAPARAEHSAAPRHRAERVVIKQAQHVLDSGDREGWHERGGGDDRERERGQR